MTLTSGGKTRDLDLNGPGGNVDGFWFQDQTILDHFPITITVHNVNGDAATVSLQVDDIFSNNELNLNGLI